MPKPKVGDQVIYIKTIVVDERIDRKEVTKATITKLTPDGMTCWLDYHHKLEECMYTANVWPPVNDCWDMLLEAIEMEKRHKEEDKALSIKFIQTRNRVTRGEL